MPDPLTPQQRYECMSHIRSKNTKPEVKLRKELFKRGVRFRINVKNLPGKPDVVLRKYHTCIFVNGCFWHGHKGCVKFVEPKTNAEFWRNKVLNNQERDLRNYRDLEAKGWYTIVVWECEVGKSRIEATVSDIMNKLETNKSDYELDLADRRKRREEWRAEIKRRKERDKALIRDLN